MKNKIYITKEFYQENFNGTVEDKDLDRLIIIASQILTYYTFNRVSINDKRAKYAVCELVDTINFIEKHEGKIITNEKVGEYSVSYEQLDKNTSPNISYKNIIRKYLGTSGAMFRGIGNVY